MRKRKLNWKKLIFILIAVSSVVIIIFAFNKPKSKVSSEILANPSNTQAFQKLKK